MLIDEIETGQSYWIDRLRLKKILKDRGLFPQTIKWIPLTVEVLNTYRLGKRKGNNDILVRFNYANRSPSKFTIHLPLEILVRLDKR